MGSKCVPIVEESGQKSGHETKMCPDSRRIETKNRSWETKCVSIVEESGHKSGHETKIAPDNSQCFKLIIKSEKKR